MTENDWSVTLALIGHAFLALEALDRRLIIGSPTQRREANFTKNLKLFSLFTVTYTISLLSQSPLPLSSGFHLPIPPRLISPRCRQDGFREPEEPGQQPDPLRPQGRGPKGSERCVSSQLDMFVADIYEAVMNLTEMESKVSLLSHPPCPHPHFPNRCEKPRMETHGGRRQASCRRSPKAHITSW